MIYIIHAKMQEFPGPKIDRLLFLNRLTTQIDYVIL